MSGLETQTLDRWMSYAVELANDQRGATAPNPPVAALLLDKKNQLIAAGAHPRAGEPHAEPLAIENARSKGQLENAHTLVVTLEPCHHEGRTPPCTRAILETPIKNVVIGTKDPNPKVKGGGARFLESKGIHVTLGIEETESRRLIRGFSKYAKTGLPWVTVKTAFTPSGSMIPPKGRKTFTSPKSIRFAHEMRKQCDAIVTGSGTVLADSPLFTVREIPDHVKKRRWLVVLDRRKRTPASWIERAEKQGFQVRTDLELDQVFPFLGEKGALEVLVEAGPTVSNEILRSSWWDEQVLIHQNKSSEDSIEIKSSSKGAPFCSPA